ncbi:MAG: YlbG family protein [Calditerricola sp.]|jgi:Uncharacterized protein conserved in bacteria|nr:DUF2129 domain-containing protein [Bacillota bacterium]MCG0313723.1 YlbG family protein [Calditerricola sp.]
MFPKRIGLAVWVHHTRYAPRLRKFGNIHYVSQRMKYVVLYVDGERVDDIVRQIERLRFVRKVERSHRHELPVDFPAKRTPLDAFYDVRGTGNSGPA